MSDDLNLSPEQQIEAAYAPGSTFWQQPDALDRMHGLIKQAAQAAPGPSRGVATSEAPPVKPAQPADARQARLKELENDPRRLAGDVWLNKEYGGLLLGDPLQAAPEPPPPELPPVQLQPHELPRFTLPKDVPPDDPIVRELAETTAYAQLPPAMTQTVIDRVVGHLATEPPSEEEAALMGRQAVAAAQKKYGARFGQMIQDAEAGQTVFSTSAQIRELLEDPRIANDPAVFEALAALGRQSRVYYTRKYGTGGRQVMNW